MSADIRLLSEINSESNAFFKGLTASFYIYYLMTSIQGSCRAMAEGNNFNLNVDGVFCISLDERVERREAIKNQFSALKNDIEFVIVERDRENPERGCFESHQKCARLALERGYRNVLILEDDANLLAVDGKAIRRINLFLKSRNPQMLYLGGILGWMWVIPFPGIVRCRLSAAHAYILSKKACSRLVAETYQGIAIDGFYCRFFRAYSAYPLFVQQQPEAVSPSDIMSFRQSKGQLRVKDEKFWKANQKRQVKELKRNIFRTLFLRFF